MNKFIYITAKEEDIGKHIMDLVSEQLDLNELDKKGFIVSTITSYKRGGRNRIIKSAGRKRIDLIKKEVFIAI